MTKVYNRDGSWSDRAENEGRIFGGVIVMWVGISFLLREMINFEYSKWWPLFATGMGIIFVTRGVLSYLNRSYRSEATGFFIGGIVFLVLGPGSYVGFVNWWPVLLILIGLSIIFGRTR